MTFGRLLRSYRHKTGSLMRLLTFSGCQSRSLRYSSKSPFPLFGSESRSLRVSRSSKEFGPWDVGWSFELARVICKQEHRINAVTYCVALSMMKILTKSCLFLDFLQCLVSMDNLMWRLLLLALLSASLVTVASTGGVATGLVRRGGSVTSDPIVVHTIAWWLNASKKNHVLFQRFYVSRWCVTSLSKSLFTF